MKKFILNADDLGLTKFHNRAVLEGYQKGFLQSASLIVNTDAYDEAIDCVIKNCPELEVGIHLNIMEGIPLTKCPLLCNKKGTFIGSFIYLLLAQYNKEVQKQIEREFRAQIEKALQSGVKITHMDSHVHIHAIFGIFKIAAKLAKEYNIEYLRTQFEVPYLVFPECLSVKFLVNLIKVCVLNFLTVINRKTLLKYDLNTNDNIIGVCYTGMMNSKTVLFGVKKFRKNVLEAVIHPCVYEDDKNNSHTEEFLITQDMTLKEEIQKLI